MEGMRVEGVRAERAAGERRSQFLPAFFSSLNIFRHGANRRGMRGKAAARSEGQERCLSITRPPVQVAIAYGPSSCFIIERKFV